MSKINNELRTLLILAQKQKSKELVTISEIAEELGVTHRQARRYIEDLRDTSEYFVDTKQGRNGGYYLRRELKEMLLPENLGVVMALAFKNNESIEKTMLDISNEIAFDCIVGDNCFRDKNTLDNICTLVDAIKANKMVAFKYKEYPNTYLVKPYKIIVTNGTCYLKGVDNELKNFDIRRIHNIEIKESFTPEESTKERIQKALSYYGIIQKEGEKEGELRVKCEEEVVSIFQKYFEYKGSYDKETKIYSIKANSVHELYYPLFRIGTKGYTFVDESFKKGYIQYLENQIRSIEANE